MKTSIDLNNKTILITGAAGFIGAALTQRILKEYSGSRVIGLDNLSDYYDVRLKEARMRENEAAHAAGNCDYVFVKGSLEYRVRAPTPPCTFFRKKRGTAARRLRIS